MTTETYAPSALGERIGELCRQFRLPTLAAETVERFSDAGHADALPTLVEVLEQEAEDRRIRRVDRLRRASKLPAGKTWDTFEHGRAPVKLRQQLVRLAEGDFVDRDVNVLAFGLPGTGKTHAMCAIGHRLVESGRSVLFIPAYRLVQDMLAAKRDLDLPRMLRKLDNLYVVFDLQMCQFVGWVRGARRWTTGESGYRSGLHRIEVWHPSRRTCGSERIQGHEARICKCGAQRHDTHGGRTMVVVAGVDVAKATLEVSVSEGHVLSFENSAAGIRRLLRHMERMGVNKAVCESTGGYERLVVGKLREAAINVQVAHPLRVRAFAKACGYEAKTDPLDAQVLSRYGVVFSESDTAQPEVDPDREELRQLLSRRRQLVEQRVRERNRLDKGVSTSVGKSTRRHVRWLDKEIERLDEEYKELLKHSANLSETVELYQTVPGVGQLTAATLVAYLPELGRWDGKALTSLVGLAPWSRDSGKKRGSRSIRGGRSTVRRALYICAWVVLRVDGDLRDFYRRLRERGKPGKVAVIAVARKLLMQLNAVARRGTPWAKQHGSDYPSYQAASA